MYYRLDTRVSPKDPDLANTLTSRDIHVPWSMGSKIVKPVPEKIEVSLNPKRGRKMRDLFLIDVPLFSDKLLSALHSAGVDNLQTFDAEIRSPEGDLFPNYKAVNIIGLVSCVDLGKSTYLPESEPPLMEFSTLVIDESKIGGQDFFRLAEDSLYILASERVKEKIEQADPSGLSLTPLAKG